MSSDTVAVCIAAHPARATNGMLDEAIRSVWAQTRLPEEIHIAMDTARAGAPATRQRALEAARADWVAFLDSDDLFLPHHLEALLRHAQETGADFVYSWFRIMQQYPNGGRTVLDHDSVFPPTHYLNEFNPADPIETTITVLVRRELAQQVGMHPLNRGQANTGEDRAFTLDCMAAGATIRHLVDHTWLWRHHTMASGVPGNTSGHATKGDAAVV